MGTLFVCSAVLFISLMVEHYDDIRNENVPLVVTAQFFVYSMPYRLVVVLPLAMILATLFSLGNLAKNNEILAIVSSGINQTRLSYPILIIAAAVSIFCLFFSETVVFHSEYRAQRIFQRYIKGKSDTVIDKNMNIFLKGKGKRFYNLKSFDGSKNEMSEPTIFEVNEDSTSLARRIDATSARLISSDTQEEKSIWVFENAVVREFDAKGGVSSIKKYTDPLKLEMEEDLQTFLSVRKKPEEMNFFQLKQYIGIVEPRGIPTAEYKTELHYKVSFPLSSLIVTLLGITFAIRTKAANMIIGFGFGIVVSIIYYCFVAFSRSMGHTGILSPFVAAWLPNVVFFTVGFYALKKRQL